MNPSLRGFRAGPECNRILSDGFQSIVSPLSSKPPLCMNMQFLSSFEFYFFPILILGAISQSHISFFIDHFGIVLIPSLTLSLLHCGLGVRLQPCQLCCLQSCSDMQSSPQTVFSFISPSLHKSSINSTQTNS